jgi:hypothetical protein
LGVPPGYPSRSTTLFEILGGVYEPCFVHNVCYEFFVTVSPSTHLDEWHLTCDPERASAVSRWKLSVPISKDVDDDRTFTLLWTLGKRREKLRICMPEEVLRNPEAINQYGQLCKERLTKVVRWLEARYGFVLMFEKRLGRSEHEFPLEGLDKDNVVVGKLPGEDEFFNASKGPMAYETTNKIKAADVSASARNARIIAEELKATRENQDRLLEKVSGMELVMSEMAMGQVAQGENLSKLTEVLAKIVGTDKSSPPPTDPGGMFG